ncbi:hypothetical protein [Rubritalea tangerina]|uniref:hypothetical protein n=1 Tax=Rubritalea tangerina TaxID=430798 RepID=UPI00361F06A1
MDQDLALLQSLLRVHRKALDGNPTGFNDEITSQLMGKNQLGLATLAPPANALSANGELLDRWGTPYRFHALSKKQMEVISAGPDKRFFTQDDTRLLE